MDIKYKDSLKTISIGDTYIGVNKSRNTYTIEPATVTGIETNTVVFSTPSRSSVRVHKDTLHDINLQCNDPTYGGTMAWCVLLEDFKSFEKLLYG